MIVTPRGNPKGRVNRQAKVGNKINPERVNKSTGQSKNLSIDTRGQDQGQTKYTVQDKVYSQGFSEDSTETVKRRGLNTVRQNG